MLGGLALVRNKYESKQLVTHSSSIGPRRIAHRQNAEELPVFTVLLDGDTQGSEPAPRELLRLVAIIILHLRIKIAQFEDT